MCDGAAGSAPETSKRRLFAFAFERPESKPAIRLQAISFLAAHAALLRAGWVSANLAHPRSLKRAIALQTIHSAGIENVWQYLGHKSMGLDRGVSGGLRSGHRTRRAASAAGFAFFASLLFRTV